ncbi:hypothetical protein KJ966_15850 [bacterium]|nr:hypothetical protein [bacterium]
MNRWTINKRRGKKSTSFKPNHDEINSAVEEYLKNGGVIKKIAADDNNLQQFVQQKESSSIVDEFLFGQ